MKELIIYDGIFVKVEKADEDAIRALHAAAPEGPAREAASTAYQLAWAKAYQPAYEAAKGTEEEREMTATEAAIEATKVELAACEAAQLACNNVAKGWCVQRGVKVQRELDEKGQWKTGDAR